MKAMLLAAGLGTRLKPFTNLHPKALAPVNGKSLLQWNIEYLQSFGIYDVVINVHHFAAQIIDALNQHKGWGSHFTISDESEAVLETGGGLLKAFPYLQTETHFLLMNVDMLTNSNITHLVDFHTRNNAIATLAVQQRVSSRQLLFNSNNNLKGWQHNQTGEVKPANLNTQNLKPLAFSGIQALSKQIFNHIAMEGKFSLIDLYLDICNQQSIVAWDHTGDLLLDVGKPESLEKAASMFQI